MFGCKILVLNSMCSSVYSLCIFSLITEFNVYLKKNVYSNRPLSSSSQILRRSSGNGCFRLTLPCGIPFDNIFIEYLFCLVNGSTTLSGGVE